MRKLHFIWLLLLPLFIGCTHERAWDLSKQEIRPGRAAALKKLKQIRLDSVEYDHLPLREVIHRLSAEVKQRDPDRRGINFSVVREHPPWTNAVTNPTTGLPSLSRVDPKTGLQLPPVKAVEDFEAVTVTILPRLKDVRLSDVLKAIIKGADGLLEYSIQDGGVIFSQRRDWYLFDRTYFVYPKALISRLKQERILDKRGHFRPASDPIRSYSDHLEPPDEQPFDPVTNMEIPPGDRGQGSTAAAARVFVERAAGVYFDFPSFSGKPENTILGSICVYNDKKGVLMVRTSLHDLRVIESALAPLIEQRALNDPEVFLYGDYLFAMGQKLGCHFTLEYRGYALTGKTSVFNSIMVTNDASVTSIPMLIAKLRCDLPGFTVKQNSKNPKIVHIIEQALDKKDYVLNKRTSLRYSGNLVGCVVKDIQGRNLVRGEGLAVALSRKVEGVEYGTEEAGSQGAFNDCVTVVDVSATNETVRSVLTDCIPLDNYGTILWRAVTTDEGAKPKVLIQFYGPKR